jgi:predicted N-acetyltransferase YhbS
MPEPRSLSTCREFCHAPRFAASGAQLPARLHPCYRALMIDLALRFAPLSPADEAAIEKLDERAFGPGRYARTAYRLREGSPPDLSLSFVARVGTLLVGANRMTPILVGLSPALLLGPLTVEPAFRSQGVGEALIKKSLDAARAAGHGLVLLVGDEDYYARVGFKPVPRGQIAMPGPVDPDRLLYFELREGAFAATNGRMRRL